MQALTQALTQALPPALPPAPRRASAASRTLAAALLVLQLVEPAMAAPLRAPRPAPSPLAPLSASAGAPAIDHVCGTDLDHITAALEAAAERAATSNSVPLPTPNSQDVGEIAVLEDDGTFFYLDKGGNPNLDIAAAGRAFYRTHGDDYDQIAFWLTTGLTNWLGSPTALAAAWPMRNVVSGIGLDTYDYNQALGLPPRLQTVLTMNGLQKYPNDPAQDVPGLPNYVTQDVLAHEFGHQWLAYPMVDPGGAALLGRGFQHWSFFYDADGSVMEGPDWVPVGPDTFRSDPPIARFSALDQYLMGVRPAAQVGPFFVISRFAQIYPPGDYVEYSDPNTSLTAKGDSIQFTVANVVAVNGPRVPAPSATPVTMRMATILVVPRGSAATASDLAKLEDIRATFPSTVSNYTGGRLLLDASLDSKPGKLRLVHRRLPDTETANQPRPVGLRVAVDPAGIPTAVNPDSVMLQWRTSSAAPWTKITMSPVAADTFTAVLPPQPAGTTVQYAFRAVANVAGVTAVLPDLAKSAPFSTHVGADVTPPVVTHWPQYTQSDARMPQALLARVTDNLGLASVTCEYQVNGIPHTVAATSAGGDSFTVSIGAGVTSGSTIAYRFVARDASAAQNVGYSNAAFDTMKVGRDHVDGFWNAGPWFHGNVRFNRRDEWHPVELAAAPSGSGAWQCGNDSIPYGPYQDAALTSGLVYDIVPGCELRFSHRYDLEGSAPYAYDGARVEVQQNGGDWVPLTPASGYTHQIAGTDEGLPASAPCWSESSGGWRAETCDLSAYAPGPIRVRFRMSTDLWVGAGGWWIDDVRVHFPTQNTADVEGGIASVALGPLWPNPVTSAFRQALRLPAAADVEWSLYDLAGRHVATLWRGRLAAGSQEMLATAPRSLAGGLYFSRVTVAGRALDARRVAIVR